jgi:hypothetical protein
MSYYTSYDIQVYPASADEYVLDEMSASIHVRSLNFNLNISKGEISSLMEKITSKFKGVVITVEGSGEESEDLWKRGFYDGKNPFCWSLKETPDFPDELIDLHNPNWKNPAENRIEELKKLAQENGIDISDLTFGRL